MTDTAHSSKWYFKQWLIQPPPNQEISSEIFFFLKVSQLPAPLRLYSGFLFLAYFSPPSLSHTHTHTLPTHSKTQRNPLPTYLWFPRELSYAFVLGSDNMHMFWFQAPYWFSGFSLMKTDQLLNSPVSASCNPASRVLSPCKLEWGFFNICLFKHTTE